MIKIFEFDYQGSVIKLEGSRVSGKEVLYVDEKAVVEQRSFKSKTQYQLELPNIGGVELKYQIKMLDGTHSYELWQGDVMLFSEEKRLESLDAFPELEKFNNNEPRKSSGHWIGLFGLGFKLFKSAKGLKVLLAGGALAGWSILFTWQFALVLIAVLVVHEYGHVWAMKRLGMKTKGFYLIPFVGGVAIGDKAKTHWQQVYIAMMGPCFGLVMSIGFYLLYLITDSHYVGLLASVSALINIFNLLPVLPLDGGQVVKSIVFSGRSYTPYVLLLISSAAFFALSVHLGLTFLAFFIVLGVVDLVFSWKEFKQQTVTSMDRYGCIFSTAWYVLSIAAFVGIIYAIAATGLPGSEIATTILGS